MQLCCKYLLHLLILNLLLLQCAEARKAKKFKTLLFRDIKKSCNADYVSDFYTNISADHLAINMQISQAVTAPADFWMQVRIGFKESSDREYRTIFAYNLNVCSLLGKELNKFSLVHLWLSNLLKYSNMPRICPWKVGIYYWRDLRPEKDSIPEFILSGLYSIYAKFYFKDFNNALYTNFTFFADIKMK